MKNILITGAAGYIGSHVLKQLGELEKYNITVVDDLSNGFKENLLYGNFIQGDIGSDDILTQVFSKPIHGVLHFSGSVDVFESMENPLKYYRNNTLNSLKLLEYCQKYEVKSFVFSSTASVYGEGTSDRPVKESDPTNPKSPYASSKLMTEVMIQDIARNSKLNYIILRYFNVAGACPSGQIGQRGKNATHLMKVCAQAACNKRENVTIFGNDYPTKDGTGVRDYIHVVDLAFAHIKALEYLFQNGESEILNCGYSKGHSVKDVIKEFQKYSSFSVTEGARRPGDIAEIISDCSKIKNCLNLEFDQKSLNKMVVDTLNWEKSLK